jgi:hypothetical protein
VIERVKSDGPDAQWTGSVPTEPGHWTGTNPILPLAVQLQIADWAQPVPMRETRASTRNNLLDSALALSNKVLGFVVPNTQHPTPALKAH